MKKLTLLLVALFSFSIVQSKDLSGNWREVKRTDLDGNAMEFSDSIQIAFLVGNEYTWQKRRGMINRGSYKYNERTLDMGARMFTVVKHTNNKLILKDQGAIYEFEPFKPSARAKIPVEKAPVAVNNINEIVGKWNVFKRTSEATTGKIDYSTLVEDVVIESKDGGWGYITSSASPNEKDGWKIMGLSDGVLNAEGKTSRRFEVLIRDGELILKENGITYFLKQF